MTEQKKKRLQTEEQDAAIRRKSSEVSSKTVARLEELESLPHRRGVLHWAAFSLSLASLVLLSIWVFSSRGSVAGVWALLDTGLSVIFVFEFFSRSGFRWNRTGYLRSRFFDFIAIVPALALVHHGFFLEGVWIWLILAARLIRVVDRFLGDGFILRTVLAVMEGFEEEITDRVLGRIIARIQADMDRAGFSHGIAVALARNKSAVLQRVRAATPHEGLGPGLAQLVGLTAVLERGEERTYDAVVEIVDSEEIDLAVRNVVNSSFSRMRAEIGKKSWRQHLGIWRRRA
jgi:hypothetical protein